MNIEEVIRKGKAAEAVKKLKPIIGAEVNELKLKHKHADMNWTYPIHAVGPEFKDVVQEIFDRHNQAALSEALNYLNIVAGLTAGTFLVVPDDWDITKCENHATAQSFARITTKSGKVLKGGGL